MISDFVVSYTTEGSDKVATEFKFIGNGNTKVGKGTVVAVDKSAETITVKTKDGTEETYHLSKDCTIDTAKGTVKVSDWTAGGVKEGTEVTVHVTDEAGKKVAHLVVHPW